MSRVAKSTLGLAIVGTIATVWGVHYMQRAEGERMYQGVMRDDQRRKEKQKQRELDFQESMKKRALYESVQTVPGKDVSHGNP